MRILAFIAILCIASTSCTKEDEKTHVGIFSNEAEGFKTVTVMIHDGGLAYFHAAVSGRIGEWEFAESESTLSLKFFDPSAMKDRTLNLRFDKKTRTYDMIRPGDGAKNDPPYDLHFISDEIPDQMVEAFKMYPEKIKQIKAQAAAEREFKKRREEQLERERPEYERIVAQIKAEPKTVLAEEFHSRELTDLGQYPPKIRAFRDTLTDHDVTYPEEVLVELINEIPDEHHSLRVLLFQRPELTGKTLTRFYPKALKWGELNYTILANIAKHPNTPIEVVRDLAGRKDVAGGATTPAKYRLEKLERANKNQ